MAVFDIVVIILVALAALMGYQRGFVIEVFSLIAFLAGIFLALKLTFPVATQYFGESDAFWLIAIGIFLLIFIGTIWVAGLFARSMKRLIDFTPLGFLDNLLGVGVSVLKWLFIFSSLLWVFHSVDMEIPKKWTSESGLYEYIITISPRVVELAVLIMPWFEDIIESMDNPYARV